MKAFLLRFSGAICRSCYKHNKHQCHGIGGWNTDDHGGCKWYVRDQSYQSLWYIIKSNVVAWAFDNSHRNNHPKQ
jgi:hypothetical protein